MPEQIATTILRYQVDQSSAQAAIASTKQIDTQLKQVSLSALELGRNGQSIDNVNARFAEMKQRIQVVKVEAQALGDTTRELNSVLGEASNAQAIEELGGSFGLMAQEEGKAEEAAARLAQRLHEIGASQDEIRAAGSAFLDAQSGGGGSGGSIFSSIGTTGQKIRALPSVQIPGTGIGTDAVGNFLRLAPALETVSTKIPLVTTAVEALTPVIGASAAAFVPLLATVAVIAAPVIALVLAFKSLTDAIAAQKKLIDDTVSALKSDTDARLEQVNTIRHASSEQIQDTIDTAKAKLAEIAIEKAAREQALKDIQDQYAALGSALDPAQRAALGDAGQAAQQSIDDLTQREKELTGVVDQNTNAILPAVTAREEETKAIEAQTAALNKQLGFRQEDINSAADTQKQILQLNRDGSQQQLDALKAANQDEQAVTHSKILQEQNLQKQYQAGSDQYKAIQDTIDGLKNHQSELIATMNALSDSTVQEAVAENDAFKAKQKIRDDEAAAVVKYNDDIKTLTQKELSDKIALYNKSIDTQVAISQKAATDAAKALSDLTAKQESLTTGLNRSLDSDAAKAQNESLNRQIKYQRTEVAAEQKHQDELERIRQQGRDREFALGLDRNFAGLAASRRQTSQELAASNQKANDDRQQRLDAFNQANDDAARQFAFDRQQKIIKYQQDLADAQAAEQKQLAVIRSNKAKQLQAAEDAYRQDLAALNSKYNAEIAMRQAAIRADLQTIAAGETAKNNLLTQAYQQAQQIIKGIFNTGGGSSSSSLGTGKYGLQPTPFANGGLLSVGQVARVNEPGSSGNEGFQTAKGRIDFPGYGTFLPSTSGAVNSNNRNLQLSMPISITTGADARTVQAMIPALRGMVDERLAYAFDRFSGGG